MTLKSDLIIQATYTCLNLGLAPKPLYHDEKNVPASTYYKQVMSQSRQTNACTHKQNFYTPPL